MVSIVTKEIHPGIFLLTENLKNFYSKFSVNCIVVAGEDGFVFDSGCRKAAKHLAEAIKKLEKSENAAGRPCRITRVIPSHGHWDHYSGLSYLYRKNGLKVLLTEAMRKKFNSPTNQTADGLEFLAEKHLSSPISRLAKNLIHTLFYLLSRVTPVNCPFEILPETKPIVVSGSNWEIISTPGHCDDHVALYNQKTGILLGGDTILRSVTTWLGPPESDIEVYLDTLEKIKKIKGLKLILPAHGSPVSEPQKRIDEIISHRKNRTEMILSIIESAGSKGVSLKKITHKLYPSTSFFQRHLAEGWIILTLEFLLKYHQIKLSGGNKNIHFIID
jgi:glyoxylase-like metal-dependent hydrolase (beta-lactamase superfamily II)